MNSENPKRIEDIFFSMTAGLSPASDAISTTVKDLATHSSAISNAFGMINEELVTGLFPTSDAVSTISELAAELSIDSNAFGMINEELVTGLFPTSDAVSTINGLAAEISTASNAFGMINEELVTGLFPTSDAVSTINGLAAEISTASYEISTTIKNLAAESYTVSNAFGMITDNLVTESFSSFNISSANISSAIPESFPALKIRNVILESFPKYGNNWNEISYENSRSKISIKSLLKNFEDYIEYDYRLNDSIILRELISSCSRIQGLAKNIQSDEDSRNSILAALLECKGISVKDQTRWGKSATGISCGELDIKIQDKRGTAIAVCEAFILKALEKNTINVHLSKLFGYDPNGLKQNFIIIYSEVSNFTELWKKYLDYLPEIDFQHPLLNIQDVSNEVSNFAEIRIALARHKRRNNITKVYHIFLNMNV